jgi:hypothetical protein
MVGGRDVSHNALIRCQSDRPPQTVATRRPVAQRLARLTDEDVETALERAVEERLSRVAPPAPPDRMAALDLFVERVSRMPVLDLSSGRNRGL